MGRICGICEHHDRFGHCLKFEHPNEYEPYDTPACEYWKLSELFYESVIRKAIKKSQMELPEFVEPLDETYANYFNDLSIKSMHPDGPRVRVTYLNNILLSKVYKFLSEVSRGDFDKALEASADVVAIFHRSLNGEGEKNK